MASKKRNVIVGQSGGPTSVINSSLAGVYKNAIERGFDKVYGMLHGVQGLLDEQYVDMSTQIHSDLDIELLKRTPSAFLGSCRYKLPEIHENMEIYDRIFEILDKLEIDSFIYIGGNDSMDTCNKISKYMQRVGYPCNIIGVPKTIDNDLSGTDHCPGYASAAKYIATSCMELYQDARVYDTGTVVIVEIMGRHAGWLAGAASLAAGADCNGPDIILLPERPFDENVFLEKVAQLEKDRHNVIIAASEGVKNKDGVFLCDLVSTAGQLDAFGHKAILSGTSRYLADLIHVRLGCKTRAIEFSTLQRCASHLASRTDITEAYQVGGASVEAAYRGETGKMCAIRRISDMPYRTETEMVDVQKVANLEKRVPDDWISQDGMHVTEAFHHYARPLIQAELTPIYIDGVPRHLHLH